MQRTAHGAPFTDQQLRESASYKYAPRRQPGLVGNARVTHLRSLQESQKVSHGATRYRKGERVRDVRGVG
jgi:hypothetical protein